MCIAWSGGNDRFWDEMTKASDSLGSVWINQLVSPEISLPRSPEMRNLCSQITSGW
jgi:hypothetical protein